MVKSNARVLCKACNTWFDRLDWMKNKECNTPEVCSCPEVQKAMQRAHNAINKAKDSSKFVTIKTDSVLFTQRDESKTQLQIDAAPIQVIKITKNPGGR